MTMEGRCVSESSGALRKGQPKRVKRQGKATSASVRAAGGRTERSLAPPGPTDDSHVSGSMGNTALKGAFGGPSGGGIDFVETWLFGYRDPELWAKTWSRLNAMQAVCREREPGTPWPVDEGLGYTYQVSPKGIGEKLVDFSVRVLFPITLEGIGHKLHLADPSNPHGVIGKFEMDGRACVAYGDPVGVLEACKRNLLGWGAQVNRDQLFRIDGCHDYSFDAAGMAWELNVLGQRVGTEKLCWPKPSRPKRGLIDGFTVYFGDKSGTERALGRIYRIWPALDFYHPKKGERDSLAALRAVRMGYPEGVELPYAACRAEVQFGGTYLRTNWDGITGLEAAVARMPDILGDYWSNKVRFIERPPTEADRKSRHVAKIPSHQLSTMLERDARRTNYSFGYGVVGANRRKRADAIASTFPQKLARLKQAMEDVLSHVPLEDDYQQPMDYTAMGAQFGAAVASNPDWNRIEKRRAAFGSAADREAAGIPPVRVDRDEHGVYQNGVQVEMIDLPECVAAPAAERCEWVQKILGLAGPDDIPF